MAEDRLSGIEFGAGGRQAERHQAVGPAQLVGLVGARPVEHQADPAGAACGGAGIQEGLPASRLTPRQEQEAALPSERLDGGIDPDPIVAVLVDPGWALPSCRLGRQEAAASPAAVRYPVVDRREPNPAMSQATPPADQPADHTPPTKEQLRVITVGELEPLSDRILIVDYDSGWPEHFEREADRLQRVLGDRALQIEHIGSTAVPGLAAKPIIDILLVVADSADEQAYLPALADTGYVLHIREPDWHEHRMFKGSDTNIHLHIFSSGCPEIDRLLLFRDWLRSNEVDRELYARTKRELAQKDWKYGQNYADAKTTVLEEIIARARDRAVGS